MTIRVQAPGDWSVPTVIPDLTTSEIHVWRAFLHVDSATLRLLEGTLLDDELARAKRFVVERDRNHFVAARGILRSLMGMYLNCAPGSVEFSYGPQGKPALAGRGDRHPLCFNLSHSHGLTLIGIGRKREIGVDVELIRPEYTGEDVAKRYFSEAEFREVSALPEESRAERFFLCWTRKEAYIKALGGGLQIPLKSFTVSLSPDVQDVIQGDDQRQWCLRSLQPEFSYVGAVAAEGNDLQFRCMSWSP
jgi:4'-phosphopantetheinyl transferase